MNSSGTVCLIKVDVEPLQLYVAVSFVEACCIYPMFFTDNFPELKQKKIINTTPIVSCFLKDPLYTVFKLHFNL